MADNGGDSDGSENAFVPTVIAVELLSSISSASPIQQQQQQQLPASSLLSDEGKVWLAATGRKRLCASNVSKPIHGATVEHPDPAA